MDSDHGPVEDLKSQAAGFRATPLSFDRRWERFDRFRYRFYLALLVFVVIVGLPIVGIPSLRHRLADRVQELRIAAATDASRPAPLMARVGENQGPLPKEYEIPVLPRQPLFVPDRVYGSGGTVRPSVVEPPSGAQRVTSGQPEDSEQPTATDSEPVYRQGALEQEAYDLVLKSNASVAGMVQGKDPAFRFKAWSAAKTDDDVYLVRVVFTQSADNAEVPYIWQVKMTSKQVSPLNYYARSLPK
jgi:hypothetical protein